MEKQLRVNRAIEEAATSVPRLPLLPSTVNKRNGLTPFLETLEPAAMRASPVSKATHSSSRIDETFFR